MNDYVDIVTTNHYYPMDEIEVAKIKSMETPLFSAFVEHVCRRGSPQEVRKSVYQDESGKVHKTNLQTIRNIRGLKVRIDCITNDIAKINDYMEAFVPPNKPVIECAFTDDLPNFVEGLRRSKDELRRYYNCYASLLKRKRSLIYLTENLKNANLQMRLYQRTMEFDITEINRLPEDMEWYIGQFLGNDYFEIVRRRCITYRYFPIAHDSLAALLSKWTCAELIRYSQHIYLQYVVTDNDVYDLEIVYAGRIPKKKGELIARILQGSCKCSFYELQRDVFLLTKIRKMYKDQTRANKREPIQNVGL